MNKRARFYFHGSLNDFLHHTKRRTWFSYSFKESPSLKDAMEAIGVPHPEVGKVERNGSRTDLSHPLEHQDQVEVFPLQLPELPEGKSSLPAGRFILDVHLGKLAKSLRMLGFDCLYENDYADATIASISARENRIVLSRDIGLLKHKAIEWGYWLRSQLAEEQVQEVLQYFKLEPPFHPFTRCMACNGSIEQVSKDEVRDRLPPKTNLYFNEFFQCQSCRRVYWKGSHYERMKESVEQINHHPKEQ